MKDEADSGPMREETRFISFSCEKRCHQFKNFRQKRKSLDFVKSILAFAFSQVGVVVLCVMYAVGGARIYMSMEVLAKFLEKCFFGTLLDQISFPRCHLRRRPTWQSKRRQRLSGDLIKERLIPYRPSLLQLTIWPTASGTRSTTQTLTRGSTRQLTMTR